MKLVHKVFVGRTDSGRMGTQTHTDITEFLAFCETVLRRSPHTIKAYRHDLGLYAAHLRKRGVSGRTATIRDMLAYAATLAGEEPRTAKRRLSAMRSFNHWLYLTEATERNVSSLVPSPKVAAHVRPPLSPGQCEAMRDECRSPRNRAVFALAYDGMLRAEEIISARRMGVAGDGSAITVVGKGQKARTVPLPELAGAEVLAWVHARPNDPWLFPSPRRTGSHIGYAALRWLVLEAARKAEIGHRVTPHDLRAASAEHERAAGGDPFVIQRLLGHEHLSTSSGYVNPVLVRVERLRAEPEIVLPEIPEGLRHIMRVVPNDWMWYAA